MNYYRKYRPQTVAQLDLTAVREAFLKLLTTGKINQAYLLTGPKGTGKTSSARILAKILHCEQNTQILKAKGKPLNEPCNQCDSCLSIMNGSHLGVVEMDAASNRGIDDIRSLRERIGLASAQGNYVVYVVDEVHMLTTEAFNALLKTLEEPPSHVVFILCTTEAQKVPETIVSRCTQISFLKATPEEVKHSLQKAIVGEKLTVEAGGVEVIAQAVDGSFRDGMKILEQAVDETGRVSLAQIETIVGSGNEYDPEGLIQALNQGQTKEALGVVADKLNRGLDLNLFGVRLIEQLRTEFIEKSLEKQIDPTEVVFRMKRLEILTRGVREMKLSPVTQLPLEMALVECCLLGGGEVKGEVRKELVEQPRVVPATRPVSLTEVVAKWGEIMKAVKPLNHSLEALLRAAKPLEISDANWLTIEVFYTFHKEQLEQERHRKLLEKECHKILGSPIKLLFQLRKEVQAAEKTAPIAVVNVTGNLSDEEVVKAAEEIFG